MHHPHIYPPPMSMHDTTILYPFGKFVHALLHLCKIMSPSSIKHPLLTVLGTVQTVECTANVSTARHKHCLSYG